MRLLVIAAVTRDDCEPVVNGRRGYEEVRLRECVSRFPAFLNQKAPLQDNVFGDLKNPPVKHGAHLLREPVIQFGPSIGFRDKLDAEAKLGKGMTLI
jgi:hypothetical protein